MVEYDWDLHAMYRDLGGPAGVHHLLSRQDARTPEGTPPTIEQVRKWRLRNKVPSPWLAAIIAAGGLNAQQYILVDKVRIYADQDAPVEDIFS